MPRYYDFEVSLSERYPLIWRRFLLRADATFADLHRAIQDACGWLDYHLYQFALPLDPGPLPIAESPAGLGEYPELEGPPADRVKLARHFGECAPRAVRYQYDFGDNWDHDVVLRAIVDDERRFFRKLIGGERSFPPEDCGGMSGFESVLAAFDRDGALDPDHELAEWLGDWRPTADIEAVRASFDATRKPRARD